MDLTARVRALPTELFDQVFQHVLVGGEPRAQYTRPVPRPKATLRCLVAYINEMLRVNNRGINFADAALCIARLFDIFDLYKSISYKIFNPLITAHSSILNIMAIVRIRLIANKIQRVQGLRESRSSCRICATTFQVNTEDLKATSLEDPPTFLLQWCKVSMAGIENWVYKSRGKNMGVLIVHDGHGGTYTWLIKKDGSYIFTDMMATIKVDEVGVGGGTMVWNLENEQLELEFTEKKRTSIKRYLCSFGEAGKSSAKQFRIDTKIAKERQFELCPRISAISKEARATKTAREGRFWALADDATSV